MPRCDQCDLCNRILYGRVTLFRYRWPPGGAAHHPGHHVSLKCVTTRLTSGVRGICDDCRRIAAEITTILEGGGNEQRDGGGAGQQQRVDEPPG